MPPEQRGDLGLKASGDTCVAFPWQQQFSRGFAHNDGGEAYSFQERQAGDCGSRLQKLALPGSFPRKSWW